MASKGLSKTRAGLHTRVACLKSMTKSCKIRRPTVLHWMVTRSFAESANSMTALVSESMVPSKSIFVGLTLSEDQGLDSLLNDGAQDVGLGDASICWSRPTVRALTLSEPMRPPYLQVTIA